LLFLVNGLGIYLFLLIFDHICQYHSNLIMSGNRKSIDQLIAESENSGFKKTLGPLNLIALGIGAIIGTGIFVLTGSAAANYAGPAIVLSFIFSGIACGFAALCYAEFASMIPVAGSAYTYSYATMGQFFAWIIGWDLILEYLFASSTVAVGWSGYMVSFLNDIGIHLGPQYIYATGTKLIQLPSGLKNVVEGWQPLSDQLKESLANLHVSYESFPQVTALFNLPAMFIVALATLLLVRGIKESATTNNIIVILKVAVVLLFIFFGFQFVKSGNWKPFIPANGGNFGDYGWSGILRGAGVIFFAYIGFDAVSTAAQEAKNPRKHMPIGILGSLIICTILYVLVSLVMTGIVPYKQLNVPAPIALAIDNMGPTMVWLRPLVKIGAIAGLSSVILVLLMGQPRIFYSMAKDGLLPESFAKVHPKFGTPHVTTMVCGLAAIIIAGTMPIDLLGELVSIGTLLAFVMVCASVIVLRRKRPDLHRPFKTPWVPLIPILGIVTAGAQMFALPLDTWLRLIIWMLIGLVIYFIYGRNNARKLMNNTSDKPSEVLGD
jgi:APA family basic amino acid/polyamine antiporter